MGLSYISTAFGASPYIDIFPFSSSGYGARYSNPSSLPAGGTYVFTPKFSPTGDAVIITHNNLPRLTGYPWSAAGYGTKYANPVSTPGSTIIAANFVSSDQVAVGSQGTPYTMSYDFNSSTGWGTRYTSTGAVQTRAVSAKPTALFFALTSTPYIAMFSCNPRIGTKFGDPSFSPSGLDPANGIGNCVSATSKDVALAQATTACVLISKWSSSGFGTKYTSIAPPSVSSGIAVKYSPDENYLAMTTSGGATCNFYIYPWATNTGQGTRYANPLTVPSGINNDSCFFNNNVSVVGGSPYIYTYPWSSSGFGTIYSNPSGPTAVTPLGMDAIYILSNYSMVASTASFALTGVNANLTKSSSVSYTMLASVGAYTLTGVNATLTKSSTTSYTMTASTGTYSLTGIATNLIKSSVYSLTASKGTFSLTGIAANLTKIGSYALIASKGTYSLIGLAINLTKVGSYTLTASLRTYSLTGIAVNLTKVGSYSLTASKGAFTLTGVNAGLTKISSYSLTVSAGSFTLVGTNVSLVKIVAYKIITSVGVFNYIGIDVATKLNRIITAALSSFIISEKNVSLKLGRNITASNSLFYFTGIVSKLNVAHTIVTSSKQYDIIGTSARLVTSRAIATNTTQFSITSQISRLLANRKVSCLSAEYYFLENYANLIVNRRIATLSISFEKSGIDVQFLRTYIISLQTINFSISEESSIFILDRKLSISSKQFIVLGIESNLLRTQAIHAEPRQFLITGSIAYLKIIHPPILCQAGILTMPVLAAGTKYSNYNVSQFPPHLEFNLTGKDVNLKPSKINVGTMSFAMEQTACALRWHRI